MNVVKRGKAVLNKVCDGSKIGRNMDANGKQKRVEEIFNNGSESWSKIMDAVVDFVFLVDTNFRIMKVNKALCEALKKEPKELIGRFCFKVLHNTDEPIPNCPNRETLITKKPATRKIDDPHLGVSLSISNSPIFDDNGELVGCVHIAKDITTSKKAEEELRRMMKKFENINEKLRIFGALTRHDIQNKLQVASNCVFLVKQKLQNDSESLELVERIESVCEHVKRILQINRTYEKLGAEELIIIDVGEIIDSTVSMFSDLSELNVVNDCHDLTVLADSLLTRLFYNLMDNSLKHGEKVSNIRIYYKTGKDSLKLVYEDDGVGIPKAEKEKIFLEGYGSDTGYGLWLIKKMCEVYDWSIQETGKHGKGAQFTITIPKSNIS